ncbi:hypothetical protein [Hymenobacter oligotrophus]|uniref:hypothetical protein n=1 Tax=Hymenobacter oligotrophus TaxID=2319843 RepID=UPI001F08BC06|nr:hypothetical protein [Hymenobacter oligotrophus]
MSEQSFFDDFTKATHPEIRDFFARYVRMPEPLPLQQYYAKVGITYTPYCAPAAAGRPCPRGSWVSGLVRLASSSAAYRLRCRPPACR